LKQPLEKDKFKQKQRQSDKYTELSTMKAASTSAALAASAVGGINSVAWLRPKSNLEVKCSFALVSPLSSCQQMLMPLQILKEEGLLTAPIPVQSLALDLGKSAAAAGSFDACMHKYVDENQFFPCHKSQHFHTSICAVFSSPANFRSPSGACNNCFVVHR
jgi:hypothetical protein